MPKQEQKQQVSTPENPLTEEDFREAVRTRDDFLPEENRLNKNAAEEAREGQPPPPRSQTPEEKEKARQEAEKRESPRSKPAEQKEEVGEKPAAPGADAKTEIKPLRNDAEGERK